MAEFIGRLIGTALGAGIFLVPAYLFGGTVGVLVISALTITGSLSSGGEAIFGAPVESGEAVLWGFVIVLILAVPGAFAKYVVLEKRLPLLVTAAIGVASWVVAIVSCQFLFPGAEFFGVLVSNTFAALTFATLQDGFSHHRFWRDRDTSARGEANLDETPVVKTSAGNNEGRISAADHQPDWAVSNSAQQRGRSSDSAVQDRWHYAFEQASKGPVSKEELSNLLSSGIVKSDTLVWKPGLQQWTPLVMTEEFGVSESPLSSIPRQDEPEFGFAGFWKRLAAFLIDQIVLLVPAAMVGYSVGLWYVHSWEAPDKDTARLIGNLVGLVLGWLYYSALESSPVQATLGKIALGIKVVDKSSSRLTFGRASGRHLAKILSALTLGVGFMMAGWTKRKQALHDLAANCFVVNSR